MTRELDDMTRELGDMRHEFDNAMLELDIKQQMITDIAKDCADYRGRWLNEHRQNAVIRARVINLPGDIPECRSWSQARLWDSSPTPIRQ